LRIFTETPDCVNQVNVEEDEKNVGDAVSCAPFHYEFVNLERDSNQIIREV
jgi:hypothetical protein